MVLEEGNLVLTKRTLDGLRAGELTFNDLVNTGVIEWVDAEEEEDLLVAPRPFDLPELSPKHSRPINPAKVEWLNLGDMKNKKEAKLSAEVQMPNGETVTEEFSVPLNYYQEDIEKLTAQQTKQNKVLVYTHVEIDPQLILGVCASLVPYPEHNSTLELLEVLQWSNRASVSQVQIIVYVQIPEFTSCITSTIDCWN